MQQPHFWARQPTPARDSPFNVGFKHLHHQQSAVPVSNCTLCVDGHKRHTKFNLCTRSSIVHAKRKLQVAAVRCALCGYGHVSRSHSLCSSGKYLKSSSNTHCDRAANQARSGCTPTSAADARVKATTLRRKHIRQRSPTYRRTSQTCPNRNGQINSAQRKKRTATIR